MWSPKHQPEEWDPINTEEVTVPKGKQWNRETEVTRVQLAGRTVLE